MPPDRAPLETRLRKALHEAAREQPMRSDFAASVTAGLPDQRAPRPRGWLRFALPSAVALAGILVLIGYSLFSSLAQGPNSSSASPSRSASPSSVVGGPAMITGETPSPNATQPPNVAFLPGVTLATLADFAGTLTMNCASYGPGGERPSPYLLHCEAVSADKTTQAVFEAGYWTLNAIQTLSLTVVSAPGQTTVDKNFAAGAVAALAELRYTGANAAATKQWAVAGFAKPECSGNNGCSIDVGGVRILLGVGVGGAMGITLEPVQ
jgi:hypothetical protein